MVEINVGSKGTKIKIIYSIAYVLVLDRLEKHYLSDSFMQISPNPQLDKLAITAVFKTCHVAQIKSFGNEKIE